MVTAAAIQMDIKLEAPQSNKENILNRIAATRADLMVFPECANSGYAFSSLSEAMPYAETIPGPFTESLAEAASQKGCWLSVGLLEKQDSQLFNTAVLVGPAGELYSYRKTHLPFLGVDRFVTPGDDLPVISTSVAKFGILICYEWRFPEVARSYALKGAEVLLGMSNWPEGARVTPEKLLPARAVENRLWIVSTNRVGTERGARYVGMSAVIDPDGNSVSAAEGKEEVLLGEIDPSLSRSKRLVKQKGEYEIDLLGDRRPDLYISITGELSDA
ncbi:MAG: carbon-nitrogen hydrolase family protein [Desulfobacterales bacterium]|nr:carbon-nitrogen hydrolase family protein [Desulfobacterales bacterium]